MRIVVGGLLSAAFLLGPSVTANARQSSSTLTAWSNDSHSTLAREAPRSRGLVQAAAAAQPAPAPAGPRRHDSLLNGVLIGAAVGGLLGLIPDYYDDCEECHDSLYGSIAVGAGIGLLVDALRTNKGTAPPAAAPRPIRVAVSRRSVAVRATFRWR